MNSSIDSSIDTLIKVYDTFKVEGPKCTCPIVDFQGGKSRAKLLAKSKLNTKLNPKFI